VATQLVALAGRLGERCPTGALSHARRALATTLQRRGKQAEASAQLRLADAAMAPGRDTIALRALADGLMAQAYTATVADGARAALVDAAVAAAREAVGATARADSLDLIESQVVLARSLYGALCMPLAPSTAIVVRGSTGGGLPSEPWCESLTVSSEQPMAREAFALAQEISREAKRKGHAVYAELADLLSSRLERAGNRHMESLLKDDLLETQQRMRKATLDGGRGQLAHMFQEEDARQDASGGAESSS